MKEFTKKDLVEKIKAEMVRNLSRNDSRRDEVDDGDFKRMLKAKPYKAKRKKPQPPDLPD
jgi:hypothetical protein